MPQPSWFLNLADARRKIEAWRKAYNGERPHSSLAYRTRDECQTLVRTHQQSGRQAT